MTAQHCCNRQRKANLKDSGIKATPILHAPAHTQTSLAGLVCRPAVNSLAEPTTATLSQLQCIPKFAPWHCMVRLYLDSLHHDRRQLQLNLALVAVLFAAAAAAVAASVGIKGHKAICHATKGQHCGPDPLRKAVGTQYIFSRSKCTLHRILPARIMGKSPWSYDTFSL